MLLAGIASVRASSLALAAFSGDSAIEMLSAGIVLRRFRLGILAEDSASRVAAFLLYLLAAYILIGSGVTLLTHTFEPRPSRLGIALTITAAVVMPLLGRAKKRLSAQTGSTALKADAMQSYVCASMSWIALMGLAVNAIFHLPWADSLAALLLLPLIVREANEMRRGNSCC